MTDRKKKVIYWVGYFVLMALGVVVKIKGLLPIVNTVSFLFGLMWIWGGYNGIVEDQSHLCTEICPQMASCLCGR